MVAVSGFEPALREHESRVLHWLHHTAMNAPIQIWTGVYRILLQLSSGQFIESLSSLSVLDERGINAISKSSKVFLIGIWLWDWRDSHPYLLVSPEGHPVRFRCRIFSKTSWTLQHEMSSPYLSKFLQSWTVPKFYLWLVGKATRRFLNAVNVWNCTTFSGASYSACYTTTPKARVRVALTCTVLQTAAWTVRPTRHE